jgi:hypothetical protein
MSILTFVHGLFCALISSTLYQIRSTTCSAMRLCSFACEDQQTELRPLPKKAFFEQRVAPYMVVEWEGDEGLAEGHVDYVVDEADELPSVW